jgi:hypothetical protein
MERKNEKICGKKWPNEKERSSKEKALNLICYFIYEINKQIIKGRSA